ncbi:MAG TPA: hypothetical protein VIM73_21420 [Polyangiaceae bacterium]
MTISTISGSTSSYSLLPTADEITTTFHGDVAAQVAAMALVASKERQDGTNQARRAEEEHLRTQQEARVEHLREQADELRAAAYADAFGQISKGGLNIMASMSEPSENSWLPGAGDIVQGGTSAISAKHRYEAAAHEADSTDAAHRAEASMRRLETLDSSLDDARDLKAQALSFLRTAIQVDAQTDQATIFLRG